MLFHKEKIFLLSQLKLQPVFAVLITTQYNSSLLLFFVLKHFIGNNKTGRRHFSGFSGLRHFFQLDN